MAGKIIIRRIGSLLPTLCLLALLILCVTVLWLSTLGFPGAALRYAERKAAEQGIALHLDSLKLDPTHGLALRAEGVSMQPQEGELRAQLKMESLAAGLSLYHLCSGELRPSFVRVVKGTLSLPLTDPADKSLQVSDINLSARLSRSSIAHLTSGSMSLQGIPVTLRGSFDLDHLLSAPKSDGDTFDLPQWLADHQEALNTIYQRIEQQQWQQDELPSFAVQINAQEETRLSLRGQVPRLDLGQFHFRRGDIDLQYHKSTITINTLRFLTEDPDASASFQGAYDITDRHLSFNMDSTAALLRMLRSLSEGSLQEYLFKFRHPDDSPPHIRLSGDVSLEEDYSLKSARVRGLVQQQHLSVGGIPIDAAELSFFYNNGNFNIDKLELVFPDGSLHFMASAEGGIGQAQATADLPVQKILDLVNVLSPQAVELPQELHLGERLHLAMHARLTTPEFKPGQTEWRGFVPTFYMLGAQLKADAIEYQGYKLSELAISAQISNIEQGDDLMPQSIGQAELHVSAKQATLPQGEGTATRLQLQATRLQFADSLIPHSIGSLEATLQADKLQLSGAQGTAALHTAKAHTLLQHLSLPPPADPATLHIAQASAEVEAEQIDTPRLHADTLQLQLSEVTDLYPLSTGDHYLTAAALEAQATGLSHGSTGIGTAQLSCHLKERSQGHIALKTLRGEEDTPGTLSATTDWTNPHTIALRDIAAELPQATTELLMELVNFSTVEFETPSHISLHGECSLNRTPLSLRDGHFTLSIPTLVRTPHKQPALRHARVPLGLKADITLRQAAQSTDLHYRANVEATHDTGAFRGHVAGTTAGQVHVTGQIDIRPDIVDQIIDSADAHSILRDFRFPKNAHVKVTGIDTHIDYSRGLRVKSTSHVTLEDIEYLMSVIEEDNQGNQHLRRDLGSNPYTTVHRGTCTVDVLVLEDCYDKQGQPVRNESIVTISGIELTYDNTPWLQRRNIKNGMRETRMQGDSIIIDIERSFVELNNIRGSVYPAYSLGMFYADLQHYLKDVHLPKPVQLNTPQCVFPIYSDCTRPMSGTIRVLSPGSASFHFIGTDIPLNDFSGFVYLTDTHVLLDRMNAKCWEGVLDASVRIGISGKSTSFDGYAKAQCMNLKLIAAAYGSKQEPALCSGEIRFRTPSPNLNALRAYGHVNIEDGDLMSLDLFRPVSELITDLPDHFLRLEKEAASVTGKKSAEPGFFSRLFTRVFRGLGNVVGNTSGHISKTASLIPGVNHLIAYDLQEAHAKFDILNGHLITRDMKAKGYNLNVQLEIDLNLNTLELKGNLWPRISSLPTILLAPLTFLSDFMVDIIIYGPVGDLKWRIGLDARKGNQPPSATSEADKTLPTPKKKR